MQTVAIQRVPQPVSIDMRRNDRYHPGKLIHSVVMDKEAMECFYCWRTCPFCCCKERLAKASYMDIYANGVEVGKPLFNCGGCGCCARDTSFGGFHHYDDPVVFGNPASKAECCSPCPFCFTDCCGCCGEAVVMQGSCGCCNPTTFFAHHNELNTCTWCPLIASCCSISVVFGLAPGEASRAALIINEAASAFKRGNWEKEERVALTMNPPTVVMMPPMAGSPMAAQQQPMPSYAAAPEQGYTPKAAAGDV